MVINFLYISFCYSVTLLNILEIQILHVQQAKQDQKYRKLELENMALKIQLHSAKGHISHIENVWRDTWSEYDVLYFLTRNN
jgi:hypothetical protein